MDITGRKVAAFAVLLFGSGFLAGAAAGAAAGSRGPAETVAEVDGRPVSRSELEEKAAASLRQLDQQRQRVLEATLEQIVEERLIAAEAARRGVTAEEYLAGEVASRSAAVSDADVEAFYNDNQARIRQPKEAVAGQIRSYLEQQRRQQARQEVVAALRKTHPVAMHLEPLRVELETAGAPSRGPAGAPVTVVEFSDFQCPYCQRMNPVLSRMEETYGQRVRLVFRQFPLSAIHSHAETAAEAALCARAQGKFWEMHDALFAHQQELGEARIRELAAGLGLDADRFGDCLASGEQSKAVEADLEAGQAAGVAGTPTVFVNGRQVAFTAGSDPYEQLAAVVDDELQRRGEAAR
jgi:protein-disulfide isomerase